MRSLITMLRATPPDHARHAEPIWTIARRAEFDWVNARVAMDQLLACGLVRSYGVGRDVFYAQALSAIVALRQFEREARER